MPRKKYNILIVDDDSELMSFLAMGLVNDGFGEVVRVNNAKDALLTYKKKKFDGLFVGGTLSDGNGLDLVKSIREKNQKIKIIFMSASISTDGAKELKGLVNGCLLKPFQVQQLLKVTHSVFK